MHICVSKLIIIGSDNGLSPGRRQVIIWTNAGILLIGPLGTNFSEILIEIITFSFQKMRLKVSSAKRQPFCLGLNVLTNLSNLQDMHISADIILRGCQYAFRPFGLVAFFPCPIICKAYVLKYFFHWIPAYCSKRKLHTRCYDVEWIRSSDFWTHKCPERSVPHKYVSFECNLLRTLYIMVQYNTTLYNAM